MWLPRGLASLFTNLPKIHGILEPSTSKIRCGALLFVEMCFLLTMHFTASDEKLDSMLLAVLGYSFFALGKML